MSNFGKHFALVRVFVNNSNIGVGDYEFLIDDMRNLADVMADVPNFAAALSKFPKPLANSVFLSRIQFAGICRGTGRGMRRDYRVPCFCDERDP